MTDKTPQTKSEQELRDRLKTYNWSSDKDYQLACIAFKELFTHELELAKIDAKINEQNLFNISLVNDMSTLLKVVKLRELRLDALKSQKEELENAG